MYEFSKRQLPQLHRGWGVCGQSAGASVKYSVKLSRESVWKIKSFLRKSSCYFVYLPSVCRQTTHLLKLQTNWLLVTDETLIVTDLAGGAQQVCTLGALLSIMPPQSHIPHSYSHLIGRLIDWLSGWLMVLVLISNISKVTHWCDTRKLPNQHFSVNRER